MNIAPLSCIVTAVIGLVTGAIMGYRIGIKNARRRYNHRVNELKGDSLRKVFPPI